MSGRAAESSLSKLLPLEPLPLTTEVMREHLRDYERLQGTQPSRAVHEAFRRHQRIEELRALVIAGSVGACTNLAERALAFGPLPCDDERNRCIAARSPAPDDVFQALQRASALHDARLLADLHREAATWRLVRHGRRPD